MKIIKLLKNDIVLTASLVLALVSSVFVLPDKEYINYINLPVLVLLFCLMLVVAGFKGAGAFDVLKSAMSEKIKSERLMIFTLCMICFFTSALITNDVALITFVPFSLAMLKNQKADAAIFCVVIETIAANLGSLITPIGNPQNLFLFTNYNLSVVNFFKITLPLGAVCLVMILISLLFTKKAPLQNDSRHNTFKIDKKSLVVFFVLFVFCILSVLKILSCYITLAIVLITVLITDKKLLKEADYVLLITFVFFFIFAGNMARIQTVYDFIARTLEKNVVFVSALISQIISNVPAATMLASFTDDAKSLILGTNIGGLGTVIASMASLISYRFVVKESKISSGKYMLLFTVFNVVMLVILLIIFAR